MSGFGRRIRQALHSVGVTQFGGGLHVEMGDVQADAGQVHAPVQAQQEIRLQQGAEGG
jgi:hypothetical protein